MSAFPRLAAVALLALLALLADAPPLRAAEPTDIADVFPAGTLAFAELHKPAECAAHLAALFKSTPLDDGLAFIHGRRDKTKNILDIQGKPELAVASLVASPEMFAELKKLRGVAVGLTGFSDLGAPEAALAVLTADTPAVGLAARAFLTMEPSVRKVAAIGTVPVYQLRPPTFSHDPMTGMQKLSNDKPPVEGPHEATFAYLPGLFVVGTSKKAVAEVVTRFQGTAKDSLLATPRFKDAAADHRRAGLFYFVNAPEFAAKFEAAMKQKGDLPGSELVAWVKMLAGGKALRSVAGCGTVRDNGLSLTAAAAFEAGQKSPLSDFLAVPGVTAELLRFAPRPATLAAAVTLPAANRSAAVLAFLDALAKANGELGRLPTDVVRELEAKHKTSVAGLLDKTKAVTAALPGTLVLHCDAADVAAGYAALVPKLVADLGGAAVTQPSSETIAGVKVFSLPGKVPVHFAHQDSRFAISLERKVVAVAIVGEPGGAGAAADAVVLLGSVTLGDAIRAATDTRAAEGPVVPLPAAVQTTPNAPLPPQKLVEDLAKARLDFFAALAPLPPATLTARRAGGELRFELFQPKVVGGGLSPVVAGAVGWFDKVHDLGGQQNENGQYGGGSIRRRGVIQLWEP